MFEELRKKLNLYLRRQFLLAELKGLKSSARRLAVGESCPELQFPEVWLRRREEGVFAVPLVLFDEFNRTLADADWKGAVSYYRQSYFQTLEKFVDRFYSTEKGKDDRVIPGTLCFLRDGRLGGYIKVHAEDATHRWAALFLEGVYSGKPIPDVPVAIVSEFLDESLVLRVLSENYVLYGLSSMVLKIWDYLIDKGVKTTLVKLRESQFIASDACYCLLKKTAFTDKLVFEVLADLSPYVREVSRELEETLEGQAKRLEGWERLKKQLRSVDEVKPWTQDYLLVSNSYEVDVSLKPVLERRFRSPIKGRILGKKALIPNFKKTSKPFHGGKKFSEIPGYIVG